MTKLLRKKDLWLAKVGKTIEVDSSMLASVHYKTDGREFVVRFKDGKEYMYEDVPPEVVEILLKSESLGRDFNRFVKNNYIFTRLR